MPTSSPGLGGVALHGTRTRLQGWGLPRCSLGAVGVGVGGQGRARGRPHSRAGPASRRLAAAPGPPRADRPRRRGARVSLTHCPGARSCAPVAATFGLRGVGKLAPGCRGCARGKEAQRKVLEALAFGPGFPLGIP